MNENRSDKRFFLAAVVLLGLLAVWKLNDISKTRLVNRTGQTFETAWWSVSWRTTFRKTA